MAYNNKGKRKVLTQRHVCSRMNFLYQAANLMAHNNNNTLAAYYGKLCRNVGTKALMHMSPALKRTLCKRCSLPLLPGVNTMLQLDEQQQKEQQQQEQHEEPMQAETLEKTSDRPNKRRSRRLRGKRQKDLNAVSSAILDDNGQLYLECSLCRAKRRFRLDTKNECWLERSDAIVQTVSLDQEAGEEERGELR
ncbi:uncharacterized protein LOC117793631 [Drosophila innubila]|uniref:uncharacterized protein LOC117793631 n=1 Tax=Drosophila innubila TaxID=198719 RepID=UPI00148CFADF|nr:uncharacterized protein LOC117793631 [Drosophila innubila]